MSRICNLPPPFAQDQAALSPDEVIRQLDILKAEIDTLDESIPPLMKHKIMLTC